MRNKFQTTTDVIIGGAGMAGLSAALHLAERGLQPLVLEADPDYCGGRVAGGDIIELKHAGRTWRFRDEHGVHGIWSPYRNLQAMLTRHNIRPMFVPAQEENWIYRQPDGRVKQAPVGSAIRHSWFPAPLHYLALFFRPRFLAMLKPYDWPTLFYAWYTLLFAIAIDPLREEQPLEGLWLSDMVRAWSPRIRAFFVGLARNGLSARPEEIPLSGFIAFLRFYTLLRRDAWAFSYMPADGGTSLIEPLVGKVRDFGGAVRLDARVSVLEQVGNGWRVHWREGDEELAAAAPQVILATDAPNTAAILRASPDTAPIAAKLQLPRGMATAVLRFWYDCTPRTPVESGIFSGETVIDNYFWLHRLQDQYAAWHKATGGSAVEVHIYGPPALLEEPDIILLSRAAADLQGAFPELRGHMIHKTIRRNDVTHTLFGLGRAERHLGIETPWHGLFCCGDWVRHPAPAFFLERACLTGIAAANAVLRTRDLSTWQLLDYPRPEPFAGFIEKLLVRGRQILRERG